MRYKITVVFEVDDNPNFNIEKRIAGQGKELTEQDIMQGFMDPEFIHPTCTIEEIKNDIQSPTVLVNRKLWKQVNDKLNNYVKVLEKISDRCCEPCCLYADEILKEIKNDNN